MKVITIHVDISRDARSVYGEIADVLFALADQHYTHSPLGRHYLEGLAEQTRRLESNYQKKEKK